MSADTTFTYAADHGNSTDPSDGSGCKSPFFWALLFGFLNNIVDSIGAAIQGFYDLFVTCFTSYITFELEMMKSFAALPRVEIICILLTCILLVNSALFWAARFMAIALPYGTPIKRALAWGPVAHQAAVTAKQAGCCGTDSEERRAKCDEVFDKLL